MIFSKKNVADYLNVVVSCHHIWLSFFFFFGQSWCLNLIHSVQLQWENSLPSHLYSWSNSYYSWYISIDFPPWRTIQIVCFHLLHSGPDGEESAYNAGDPGSIPVGKIPWRREWLPIPVFLPEEAHGQSNLAGYGSWGHKESDTTDQGTLYLF